jgi:hypothetical protein
MGEASARWQVSPPLGPLSPLGRLGRQRSTLPHRSAVPAPVPSACCVMEAGRCAWAQALRARLPKDAAGRAGGRSAQQAAAAALLPAPLLLAALAARRRLWRAGLGAATRGAALRLKRTAGAAGGRARALLPVRQRSLGAPGVGSAASTPRSSPQVPLRLDASPARLADAGGIALALPAAAGPAWLPAAAAAAGVGGTAAALSASLALIPRQVAPWLGWTLVYELTALGTTSLFALFLQACHRLGRGPATAAGGGPPGGGAARPWGASAALLGAVVVSLGLVPWWADLLAIRLFALKAIATFVLGALTGEAAGACGLRASAAGARYEALSPLQPLPTCWRHARPPRPCRAATQQCSFCPAVP